MGELKLTELKKIYGELEKKYKLPSFAEMNNDFDIDKIEMERENLLKAIRKVMLDKVFNIIGFFDMILNPVNAPMMYHSFIKSITTEDKKLIDKVYAKLGDLILDSFVLEVKYSEEDEVKAIKNTFNTWDSLRPDLKKIFERIRKPASLSKKEKSYFG